MRIVFMGTPEFAVPSLKALIEAGYDVVACCTQPDRPSGRGKKLTACPVKEEALRHGIPVYQFEKIRRQEKQSLRTLKPTESSPMVWAHLSRIFSRCWETMP